MPNADISHEVYEKYDDLAVQFLEEEISSYEEALEIFNNELAEEDFRVISQVADSIEKNPHAYNLRTKNRIDVEINKLSSQVSLDENEEDYLSYLVARKIDLDKKIFSFTIQNNNSPSDDTNAKEISYSDFLEGVECKSQDAKHRYEIQSTIDDYAKSDDENASVFMIDDDFEIMSISDIKTAYPHIKMSDEEIGRIRKAGQALIDRVKKDHSLN